MESTNECLVLKVAAPQPNRLLESDGKSHRLIVGLSVFYLDN